MSQIRLRLGEYDFSNAKEPFAYVERAASKKIVHPKYNFFTYEYDLALVRLEEAIDFQPNIAPICLPATENVNLVGMNATVTGWGRLSEGGTLPSKLQQVGLSRSITLLYAHETRAAGRQMVLKTVPIGWPIELLQCHHSWHASGAGLYEICTK